MSLPYPLLATKFENSSVKKIMQPSDKITEFIKKNK